MKRNTLFNSACFKVSPFRFKGSHGKGLYFILGALFFGFIPPANSKIHFEFEKTSGVPLVSIAWILRAGSTSDPAQQYGLTYFVNEMLLRGTQARSKEQIDLALDQMGATLEIETRAEHTQIQGQVLSSLLPAYLSLVEELLSSPSFNEKELQKLKKETLSALIEERSKDSSIAGKLFNQFIFAGHPYGNPPQGDEVSIAKISGAQLKTHYQRIYAIDPASSGASFAVIASGNADQKILENSVLKLESLLNRKTDYTPPRLKTPEFPKKIRAVLFHRAGKTQSQVLIAQPGITLKDPSYPVISLVNEAFGGASFSSRLMKEIRVKRGWSYGAYSSFSLGSVPRAWILRTAITNANVVPAVQTMFQMIQSLQLSGLASEEHEFTRAKLLNNQPFTYHTPQARMSNRVSEWLLGLEPRFFERLTEKYAETSLLATQHFAAKFFQPESLTLGVLGNSEELRKPLAEALKLDPEAIEVIPVENGLLSQP